MGSAVIDCWKVTKVLKLQVDFQRLRIERGGLSEAEKRTSALDATAMDMLGLTLGPLVMGFALYSLVYHPHKSWYSWVVESLANGIYVFGFIFMTPQLFINYKLKSVSHLPWRVMVYKFFNTFIDDVFSFLVSMPTSHRIACFRDDIVFFIFLYQRWLYPVDRKRANEFGFAYEDEGEGPEATAANPAVEGGALEAKAMLQKHDEQDKSPGTRARRLSEDGEDAISKVLVTTAAPAVRSSHEGPPPSASTGFGNEEGDEARPLLTG
uniref:Cleft lip and palate transmembrane protein 1 n=1 Tax=Rhizochromulina marina TaxID=1034831 RepID=A0A7S2SU91_9STRA